MATSFPTSLDALTNPTGSSSLTSPDHAGQHTDANDAIEALQAKVGVNSSAVTSSLDYKITTGIPSGVINMWSTTTAPTGWLICDGTTVSRTTYAALFAVISTTYGVGDGSTTFTLPNLKGKVPVGRDSADASFDTMGELGGAKTHTLTSTEMPSHTHTQDSHNHTQNSHNHTQDAHNHTQNAHGHTVDAHSHLNYYMTGDAGAHNHTYDRATAQTANRAGTTFSTVTSLIQTSTNTNTQAAHAHTSIAYTGDTSPGVTATTATNIANTATNQAQTATNIAATATNQNTGGGGAHNNLQPYIVLNYIIKA